MLLGLKGLRIWEGVEAFKHEGILNIVFLHSRTENLKKDGFMQEYAKNTFIMQKWGMSKQKYAKSEREEAKICKTKLFLATIKQKYAKKPFYMQKYAKKKGGFEDIPSQKWGRKIKNLKFKENSGLELRLRIWG